jgi:hypothetical protein
MQSEDPRHRRRFRTPRAPQPQDKGRDRREGMAVDLSKINCPARAAARAEHVEPWRPRDQSGPDRRRPQHVTAGGKLLVPTLDDGLRLGARGRVGIPPLGSCANVESPRQHSHRGRIAESLRLIKWRNARLGSGANHEGACRAFSTILHIGVFERRRRSYWRRSLTTRSRRPQPSKSPRNTNV